MKEYILFFLLGVLAGVFTEHLFFKPKKECDPVEEEAKQKIFDTLTAVKKDIESH